MSTGNKKLDNANAMIRNIVNSASDIANHVQSHSILDQESASRLSSSIEELSRQGELETIYNVLEATQEALESVKNENFENLKKILTNDKNALYFVYDNLKMLPFVLTENPNTEVVSDIKTQLNLLTSAGKSYPDENLSEICALYAKLIANYSNFRFDQTSVELKDLLEESVRSVRGTPTLPPNESLTTGSQ